MPNTTPNLGELYNYFRRPFAGSGDPPFRQYHAGDIGFGANQARLTNAGLQRLGQSALKSTKPSLDLIKVEKHPGLSSAFENLVTPLQNLFKSQAQTTKTLKEQRDLVNPLYQAAMLEDVNRVTSNLGDFKNRLNALEKENREALTALAAESQNQALGFLERYGAGRPALGMSSELGKIAADRIAAARLPYALQTAQMSADFADRLARQQASALGQRQELLSKGYGFLRSQDDNDLRPLINALNLLGQSGDVYGRLNFLGVGGETGQTPYTLPVFSTQRVPAVSRPYVFNWMNNQT